MTTPDHTHVCATCGQTTNKTSGLCLRLTPDGPEAICASPRLVSIAFVVEKFGPDWRQHFDPLPAVD